MLEKRFGSTTEAREKFKTCLRVNPKNSKVYQVMWDGIKRDGMRLNGMECCSVVQNRTEWDGVSKILPDGMQGLTWYEMERYGMGHNEA